MAIPFTQFLLPDGRMKQVEISRPDDVEAAAMALVNEGYTFTCEVLANGMVSLACVDPEDEGDVAISIAQGVNDPSIPERVDTIVHRAQAHFERQADEAS